MASDLSHYLALWRTPKVGPVSFFNIVKSFPYLSDAIAAGVCQPDWVGVERDLAWAEGEQRHIITWKDDAYPPFLREIPSAPPLLFVEGNPKVLSSPQLAMVGSRHPSQEGLELARQFASYLSKAGFSITSGLALGIDGASHQGVLDVSGITIAVTGTGLDQIYPVRHQKLARQIVEQGGALISEFPIGVGVHAQHFPRRNRLISGLSMGVLVVEAAVGSGSLITARYANEQGREVFAIPGSIHNPMARGCHALIRQGAKLVETGADIVEELGGFLPQLQYPALSPNPSPASVRGEKDEFCKGNSPLPFMGEGPGERAEESIHPDPKYHTILNTMNSTITPLDLIIAKTGLTAEAVSSMLLTLELEGWVTRKPGGYMRNPT